MKRLGPVIILIFALAIAVHYRIAGQVQNQGTFFTQLLYLPSGKYLKPAAFGYDLLLADFVYLWSIQYYGDPGFHPKLEYLRHTYDIVTELDPNFLDAYQTGAFFMFYDMRNPKAGLELLDRGLERNPKEWIIAADAGFYCMMNLRDYSKAADYFQKAADVPGAPQQARRMVASLKFRTGDRVQAYLIWKDIYETSTKASIKQVAYHHMHDLKILVDLDALRAAIANYKKQRQRLPLNLNQLVAAGLIRELPVDPEGNEYLYDPTTGKVSSKAPVTLYKRYQ